MLHILKYWYDFSHLHLIVSARYILLHPVKLHWSFSAIKQDSDKIGKKINGKYQ